jgi:prepilin-type processing-associated H-X9-DG protein
VVATIAILLTILLPGLRRARQFARDVVCQSNLAQIAKGWQLYLNAYDGSFYQSSNAYLDYGGWKGDTSRLPYLPLPRPLNPFLSLPDKMGYDLPPAPNWNAPETIKVEEDAKVFRCPNDNGGVPATLLLCFQRYGTSYRTNDLLIGQVQTITITSRSCLVPLYQEINKRLRRMNVSRAYDHSHLVLIGDYGWANQFRPEITAKTEWHSRPAYHNVAFLDGHVEMVHIRKGLFVTPSYRVLPFEDLDSLALSIQIEEP